MPADTGNSSNVGSTLQLGRFPGEGNDNPFQYSCLANSTDRGAWQATVHGVSKSWKQFSAHVHTHTHTHTHTSEREAQIPYNFS